MTLDDIFPGITERLGRSIATHDSFASECVTWPLVDRGRPFEVTVRQWDMGRVTSGDARRFAFAITDGRTGETLAHGSSSNPSALATMIVNARRRLAPVRASVEPLAALPSPDRQPVCVPSRES